MAIPIETFGPESIEIYPDPPWLNPRQVPRVWFQANAKTFVYTPEHIIAEAEPYVFGCGPYRPGIYFLLVGDRIIYAGQSNGISRRLMQHAEKDWPFDRYWCFGGVPELFVEEVEAYYIEKLNPPLNRKRPDCSHFKSYIGA